MSLFVSWFQFTFMPFTASIALLIYLIMEKKKLQNGPHNISEHPQEQNAAEKLYLKKQKMTVSNIRCMLVCLFLIFCMSVPYAVDAITGNTVSVITSDISGGQRKGSNQNNMHLSCYTYRVDARDERHTLKSNFDYATELGFDFDSGKPYVVTYHKLTKVIKSIVPIADTRRPQ